MTLQTWILIGAVFVAVVLSRMGRHRYSRRQRLLTVGIVTLLIVKYVRGMPTAGNDGVLEASCVAIGALFGLGMLAVTSVDRDATNDEIWIRAGIGYLALWVVMLGSRVLFAYSSSGWARSGIGHFLAVNHLTATAITPAFVLMTVGSLAVVTVGTAMRASSLRGSPISTDRQTVT